MQMKLNICWSKHNEEDKFMLRKCAPKWNTGLYSCFPYILQIIKKNPQTPKPDCIEVLIFESNKLYNLYTEKDITKLFQAPSTGNFKGK